MKTQHRFSIFSLVILLAASTTYAVSFGTLPIPSFGLSIPYPEGWQNDIQVGPGNSFLHASFTPNKEDATAPVVFFLSTNLAAAMGMATGSMMGSLKAASKMPSAPGAGGRWSQTQQTPEAALGPVADNCRIVKQASVTWLGRPASKQDRICTESDDKGVREVKSRMIGICFADGKNYAMGCSASLAEFTPEFGSMCDQLIKGVKRIK